MLRLPLRRALPLCALLVATPVPAIAQFLAPDWSELQIAGVVPPDWLAGVNDGKYVGMCTGCEGMMMLEIQTTPDDGTGGRVHSGETTAQTFIEIGQANAERLGGETAFYDAEAIAFAAAKGFKTSARAATGDYSATYQLWSDGQQLIVRVYGPDRAEVDTLARTAFKAAAPLTFQ